MSDEKPVQSTAQNTEIPDEDIDEIAGGEQSGDAVRRHPCLRSAAGGTRRLTIT